MINLTSVKTLLALLFISFIGCNTSLISQCITNGGGAIINEFSNGQSGNQEFIELLVIGSGDVSTNVSLQGYIVDDNNQASQGVGTESGHIRLGPCFSNLVPGQLIVIYNDDDIHPSLPQLNSNSSELIIIPFNDPCIIKMEGCPSHTNPGYDCGYQVNDPNAKWVDYIAAQNYGDKMQLLNIEKETVHEVTWGLPNPSKSFSTQNKAYIHSTDYSFLWKEDSLSTPGTPNNYDNYEFINALKYASSYEPISLEYSTDCGVALININSGFPNYSVELFKVGPTSQSLLYSSVSSSGLLNYHLGCGKYNFIVTDKFGCTEELSFTMEQEDECIVDFDPNQTEIVIGNQCESCDENGCFEWVSSNSGTFGFGRVQGEIISLPISKVNTLKSENGSLTRYLYDLEDGSILAKNIFWFNTGDDSTCEPINNNICTGIDSDGDGICDDEDGCPNSQDNDDTDNDGICDIFDCDPDNPNGSIDSDGDGYCDSNDCAPDDPEFHQDSDGDGVCDNEDCQPFNSLVYYGGPCDDGSSCTKNDTYNKDCNCVGQLINDCNEDECTEGQSCDDNDPCTKNDKFDNDCNCAGEPIYNCNECELGSACDDNNVCTKNDIFDEFCNCVGTPILNCDDDCIVGTNCDDNDPCTTNDTFDSRCNCIGTPLISLDILQELVSECNGEIKLTASGGDENYSWYKDGEYLNNTEPYIIINDPGEYKVSSFSSDQCEFSKTISISENTFSQFIEISSSDESICNSNDPVILSVPDSYSSYRWYYEGIEMPNESGKYAITVTQEGNYEVKLTDDLQCPKIGVITLESDFKTVQIEPQNPVFCPGVPVTLSIENSSDIVSVVWTKPDGTQESGFNISASMIGDYSVIVMSDQNCLASDKVTFDAEDNLDIDKIYHITKQPL